ncbi:MAG TPA: hypothetical protein VGK88_04200 [bacterium]|jgi:hypothetical protein
MRIGLLGFGNVGGAVVGALRTHGDLAAIISGAPTVPFPPGTVRVVPLRTPIGEPLAVGVQVQ